MKNHFGTPQKIISRNKSTKLSARYKKSQALINLEKLSFDAKIERYPSNPYPVGDKFEDRTANGPTKAIIAFLRINGNQAERVSNTGRPIDKTTTFIDVTGRSHTIGSLTWIKGSGVRGTADIHCCIKGRAVYVEVKIGKDKMSQEQKNYQKQVVSAFGIYYIARDFETFVAWFNLKFDKP